MQTVQISARIIRWPMRCACCSGRDNTTVEVSHTRTTGVKVIREQTKSWRVPYCRRCLDHIDAAVALARFGWVVVPRPAAAVVSCVTATAGVFAALARLPAVPAGVLGFAWLFAVAAALYLALPWCVRTHRAALRKRDLARRRLVDELDCNLRDGCAVEDRLAAGYEGWDGSVHTFWFANPDFAHEFRRINSGKVLN